MGDLFHKDVDYDLIVHVFAVMALSSQHVFQVLTKRAERMHAVLTLQSFRYDVAAMALTMALRNGYELGKNFDDHRNVIFPLRNVIGMVTAEDQTNADERVGWLLRAPFAWRGVSVEPMLGPVDLRHIQYQSEVEIDALTGDHGITRPLAGRSNRKLNWVIVGGETGPGARAMHPQWGRDVRNQCIETGTPFFFKSWGDWAEVGSSIAEPVDMTKLQQYTFADGTWMARIGKKRSGRLLDGVEWNLFPQVH